MHTADNAIIIKDEGTSVTFIARCPECGNVMDGYFGEKTEAVNKTGKSVSPLHKCDKCGAPFKITFYGM